jgi:hypothetical protein
MTTPFTGPPPQNLQAVLQSLGFALWQTQTLENALVSYLVMVHKVPFGSARADVEHAFLGADKRTLGQLLHELKNFEGKAGNLVVRLDAFLPERNWLVHKSRHTSHADVYKPAPTLALLTRLERLADDALSLAQDIQVALEQSLTTHGITRDFIERKSREIVEEWAKPDPPSTAS